MDICALPGCSKPIKNWRTYFCCTSHGAKYGHTDLPKLPRKDYPEQKPIKIKLKKWRQLSLCLPTPIMPYKYWTPEKKGKYIAYMVERRKKRDKSMPCWANKEAIEKIYIKARQLTKETGIKHEVDHIVPSNHALVCGLHVETNLQILTEFENISKKNYFEV